MADINKLVTVEQLHDNNDNNVYPKLTFDINYAASMQNEIKDASNVYAYGVPRFFVGKESANFKSFNFNEITNIDAQIESYNGNVNNTQLAVFSDNTGMLYSFIPEGTFVTQQYVDDALKNVTSSGGSNGADGAPGADGSDGKDGVDGKDGKDGEDGLTGVPGNSLIVKYCLGRIDINEADDTEEEKKQRYEDNILNVKSLTEYTSENGWKDSTTELNIYDEELTTLWPYIYSVHGIKSYSRKSENSNEFVETITWGAPFRLTGKDGENNSIQQNDSVYGTIECELLNDISAPHKFKYKFSIFNSNKTHNVILAFSDDGIHPKSDAIEIYNDIVNAPETIIGEYDFRTNAGDYVLLIVDNVVINKIHIYDSILNAVQPLNTLSLKSELINIKPSLISFSKNHIYNDTSNAITWQGDSAIATVMIQNLNINIDAIIFKITCNNCESSFNNTTVSLSKLESLFFTVKCEDSSASVNISSAALT